MAYVYEPLSDENWKELVRLNPDGPYLGGRPWHWLNDRERDIQFASLGGRGDAPEWHDVPPDYYVLIWHKQVIRFEARYTCLNSGVDYNDQTVTQDVFAIYAPKALKLEEQAIREDIPQALLAYWRGLSHTKNVLAVHATLPTIHFI